MPWRPRVIELKIIHFGGTDSEVTYIVFHGPNAVVNVIEDGTKPQLGRTNKWLLKLIQSKELTKHRDFIRKK